MRGEKKVIDDKMGLHHAELSYAVNRLKYMEAECKSMLRLLDARIDNTYAEAPARLRDFCLGGPRRDADAIEGVGERCLERAIWEKWNHAAFEETGRPFFGSLCRYIQTVQMPLQPHGKTAPNWGKIDLVGVTAGEGLPVVFELKEAESRDTPLGMLTQGLAYAIALRKAWDEGGLRNEWQRSVPESKAPWKLPEVPVFGVAPVAYWARRIGQKGVRSDRKVSESAWEPFRSLCTACLDWGFPITLLQFELDQPIWRGRPAVGDPTLVRGIETAGLRADRPASTYTASAQALVRQSESSGL